MGTFRLILALAVFLAHLSGLGWGIPFRGILGGDAAVQCFFVISGFFIALILNEKYVTPADRWLFYTNRLLRIFVPYAIFLTIAAAIALVTAVWYDAGSFALWFDLGPQLRWFDIVFLAVSNLTLVGQDLAMFLRFSDAGLAWTTDALAVRPAPGQLYLIAPAWTLSLELMFYAIAPFLVRRRTTVLVAVVAVSLGARWVASLVGLEFDPWSYRFFPFELALFVSGALSYRIYVRIKDMPPTLVMYVLGGGVILSAVLHRYYGGSSLFFSEGRIALLGYVVLALPFLYRVTRDNRRDRQAGEWSYPVYLCHGVVLQPFYDTGALGHSPVARGWIAIALTLLVAGLVMAYVERPLDRYRQRRRPPAL